MPRRPRDLSGLLLALGLVLLVMELGLGLVLWTWPPPPTAQLPGRSLTEARSGQTAP